MATKKCPIFRCVPQNVVGVRGELSIVDETRVTDELFDQFSRFEAVHSKIRIE